MDNASTSNEPLQNPLPCSKSAFSKLSVNRKRQDGNPILKYIRKVPYEWAESNADFECTKGCGIFYLVLKYHKLHPGYIETRIPDGNKYSHRILLILQNVEEPTYLLRDLNMFCFRNGWTMILSYSVEEAAEYIENLKLAEGRHSQTVISNRQQYMQQKMSKQGRRGDATKEQREKLLEGAVKFLSSIRSVTTTDAKRLLGTFGSIAEIANATKENLELCPGLGPMKAQNIYNFFRSPFLV